MLMSSPVDDFRIAYIRDGVGPSVVLLHGWPGDHADYREVTSLLKDHAQVVAADLRGFGESEKHRKHPASAYSAEAQARSIVGLIDELGLEAPVIGGYDIGSRIAQTIARKFSDRVRALVISPPLPGAGNRVLSAEAQREFWYQAFHQLEMVDHIVDGNPRAVRAYLRHFWSHWSGPGFEQSEADLDRLVKLYGEPGAFIASIGWYRAGSGAVAMSLDESPPHPDERLVCPTTVLWPQLDPLFPVDWGDRLGEFFSDVTLQTLEGVGHFVPVEAPQEFATAIQDALKTC